jgi:glucose/mannose-6-phosphate isomerase
VICVTSGGKVEEMARANKFDVIKIPGGNPPRSCIGYSLVQLIKIAVHYSFAPVSVLSDVQKSIDLIKTESENIKSTAMQIAKKLQNKLTVIYSLGSAEGVSVRFRQQINENSKMLCWHHVFPEMNHNELVGWTTKNDDLAVVTFKTSFDYKRTVKRYEVCKPIFEKYSSSVTDITAKGHSKLEQYFYLIHLGDWISCYLADLKNIDPVEVNVIDHLKKELSKF